MNPSYVVMITYPDAARTYPRFFMTYEAASEYVEEARQDTSVTVGEVETR